MSDILICGDSWGCGEWNVECTEVLHPGLEWHLKNAGHHVTNISRSGGSNLDTVNRLSLWLERFGDDKRYLIFVFQTEYTRDFKHNVDSDWNIDSVTQLSDQWIARFYMRLSDLAQKYQCDIKIIGGCSDTQWFDNMNLDHPGCEIACQSLTNLLIYDNHRSNQPVFSWYDKNCVELLDKIKQHGCDKAETLLVLQQGFEREDLLRSNPQLFFPDGKHPNRQGHKKLFEFLTVQYFCD